MECQFNLDHHKIRQTLFLDSRELVFPNILVLEEAVSKKNPKELWKSDYLSSTQGKFHGKTNNNFNENLYQHKFEYFCNLTHFVML